VSDQTLDARAALGAVRRRWLLVGSLGAAGLCGGLAYGALEPAMHTANALVLLPAAATTTPGVAVPSTGTQIAIATSTPVLAAAGRAADPSLAPQTLAHRISVRALSDSVLSITASAPRTGQAELLANAVASSYVRFVTSAGTTSSGQVLTGLNSEAAQLTTTLQGLQNQIASVTTRLTSEPATSPAAQQDASLLGSLRTEQASFSQQLNNVDNQIVDTRLSDSLAGGGVRVLQRATTATDPSAWWPALDAAIGLVAGLLVGTVAALIAAGSDRRLRRRNDLASALGLPVLASVNASPQRDVEGWNHVLEQYRPSARDHWSLRQMLRRLDVGSSRSHLGIVVLADDRSAQVGAVMVAIFAASAGVRTSLRIGGHGALVALRAACRIEHRPDRPACLDTAGPATGAPSPPTSDRSGEAGVAELIVEVEAVDRDRPSVVAMAARHCVVAVTAGTATGDDLARTALAVSDAGVLLDGILLVNPDPGDHTTGDLPAIPGRQVLGHPEDDTVRSLVEPRA